MYLNFRFEKVAYQELEFNKLSTQPNDELDVTNVAQIIALR
jgi:hypothetical protein